MRLKYEEARVRLPLKVENLNPASRVVRIYALPGENCEGLSLAVGAHMVLIDAARKIDRFEVVANLGPLLKGVLIDREIMLPSGDTKDQIRLFAVDEEGDAWFADGNTDEEVEALLLKMPSTEHEQFKAQRADYHHENAPVLDYLSIHEGRVGEL